MRKLTFATLCLTFVVILLGAFTRLTDAGLGCPDWPGCYGFLSVPSAENIVTAEARFPERPVEVAKAWIEMVHRYIAGTLGLAILALALLSWRKEGVKLLPWLLVGLVSLQAALGMWTVTLNLLPVVVMAHLLGGFAIFSLLFCYWLQQKPSSNPNATANTPNIRSLPLQISAGLGLLVLVVQIILGGWTSANYAALVCTELPWCEGDWLTRLDPQSAFAPLPPPAASYEFGVLDYAARMTIHVSHRIWAVITMLALLTLCWQLYKQGASKAAKIMAVLLFLQLSLGIANVVASLPLAVAVAHNGMAALLLLSVIWSNYFAWQGMKRSAHDQTATCYQ